MNRCFVIGNGPSRRDIDLSLLVGETWGCNALYRDFAPDNLVVIDQKMQEEVWNSKYYKEHICRFKAHSNPGRKPIYVHPNIRYFKQRLKVADNSGLLAIFLALKAGNRDIWLLGFDFQNPKNPLDNNVYAGTPQYAKHGKRAPHFIDDVAKRIGHFARANIDKVQFTRVWNPETCTRPPYPGFSDDFMRHITVAEAKKELNIE